MQNLKFYCKDRRLLFYMSRTLHLFGTDWCAMMVPIQVIRWYRMQCYDGTDSCAIVVPIRRYCHIHRSFIVNISYIDMYYYGYVVLENGMEVHIGDKYREELKSSFHFWGSRNRNK